MTFFNLLARYDNITIFVYSVWLLLFSYFYHCCYFIIICLVYYLFVDSFFFFRAATDILNIWNEVYKYDWGFLFWYFYSVSTVHSQMFSTMCTGLTNEWCKVIHFRFLIDKVLYSAIYCAFALSPQWHYYFLFINIIFLLNDSSEQSCQSKSQLSFN